MEIAFMPDLIGAIPDVDQCGPKDLDQFSSKCDAFFAWERERMLLGDPNEDERREHRQLLQLISKVTKLLLKVQPGRSLELLKIRIDDSWGMFYSPMSEGEAKAILAKAFPE